MSASGSPSLLTSARHNSRAADHCLSQAMAFADHDPARARRLVAEAEAALSSAASALAAFRRQTPTAQLVKHVAVLAFTVGPLWYVLGSIPG